MGFEIQTLAKCDLCGFEQAEEGMGAFPRGWRQLHGCRANKKTLCPECLDVVLHPRPGEGIVIHHHPAGLTSLYAGPIEGMAALLQKPGEEEQRKAQP